MNIAEALAKTEVKGRVLLVGSPAEAVAAAERLGLSEVFIADTDHQALENTAKTHTSLKINPVYTRVVERWVELPSSSFDAVVSLHSLERAVNKRAFMTEARRLLKDGGKFLIAVKVKGFLRKQGLRKEELEKLLNTQGFKTEALAYGGGEAFAVLVKT